MATEIVTTDGQTTVWQLETTSEIRAEEEFARLYLKDGVFPATWYKFSFKYRCWE